MVFDCTAFLLDIAGQMKAAFREMDDALISEKRKLSVNL